MTKITDKINSFRKNKRVHIDIDNLPELDLDQTQQRANTTADITVKEKLPKEWYYSFEFFPPKTEAGLDNLLTRIDRMSSTLDPLFIDVTWGESGSTSVRSMAVAAHVQRYCGVDVLLHLTCTGIAMDQLSAVLRQARSHGVQNILALRGDPPRGKRSWCKDDISGGECKRAVDLVRFIREEHGDHFCIAVAGHPEGHPASHSKDDELKHLKEKIDAGADFIITQFFYDPDVFITYVKRCRAIGITCPILPGILPIQSYASFIRMTQFCDVAVPDHIMERLEPVKDDDEAAKIIGCEIAIDIATKILTTPEIDGGMDGVHFYTLNLERSVTRILMAMDAVSTLTQPGQEIDTSNCEQDQKSEITASSSLSAVSSLRRQYPWRPSAIQAREKEDVRPINWANRPKSYVMRTDDWDEFPNGRWGDSTSPAFGELSAFSHFYSFTLGTDEDRLAMLGEMPTKPQNIYEVFAQCKFKNLLNIFL
jgi:methylenetetrahydrofolate reductase (NADPH)